eukprot:scaffold1399_cov410-Prasinococcus_capsulatus_cf.AAC.46
MATWDTPSGGKESDDRHAKTLQLFRDGWPHGESIIKSSCQRASLSLWRAHHSNEAANKKREAKFAALTPERQAAEAANSMRFLRFETSLGDLLNEEWLACDSHLIEILGNIFPSLHLFLSSSRKEIKSRSESLLGGHDIWPLYTHNSVRDVQHSTRRGELPNVYGILHYIFLSPTPAVQEMISLSRRHLPRSSSLFTVHMRRFHIGDDDEHRRWLESVSSYVYVTSTRCTTVAADADLRDHWGWIASDSRAAASTVVHRLGNSSIASDTLRLEEAIQQLQCKRQAHNGLERVFKPGPEHIPVESKGKGKYDIASDWGTEPLWTSMVDFFNGAFASKFVLCTSGAHGTHGTFCKVR